MLDELGLVCPPDVVIAFDLAEQEAEPLCEIVGAEVMETGRLEGLGEHMLDAHVERLVLGGFEHLPFLGTAIVVAHALDPQDGHGHSGSSLMSDLPALAIHPPSTMTTSPVWKLDRSLMK